MEKKNEDPPQKMFLLDPVYKSALVYRPSEYYDDVGPKYNYYDDYHSADLEAQKKEEQKAILAEGASAKRVKRRRTCTVCCCSLFYVSFILLLASVIVLVKLIPKDPAVSFGDISIPEFVYNQTGSQQQQLVEQLQVSLRCGLNVTNRNPHARAIYKEMALSVLYKNESLGSFKIESPGPQFEQNGKMKTLVFADLPSKTTTIGAANAEALRTSAGIKNVQVDFKGNVKGQFKVLGMKVKKFDVGIDCKLNVKPGGDGGSLQGQNLSFSCYYDN